MQRDVFLALEPYLFFSVSLDCGIVEAYTIHHTPKLRPAPRLTVRSVDWWSLKPAEKSETPRPMLEQLLVSIDHFGGSHALSHRWLQPADVILRSESVRSTFTHISIAAAVLAS